MAANGKIPASQLVSIGNGYYLAPEAAHAFNAMSAEAQRRWGRPIRVIAAYRTLERQVYFWDLYRSGRGNLAAQPGTSNHGLGLAVDLASRQDRWMVDQIGRKYGFAKEWSDAQSEWWHIKYRSGVWKPTPAFVPLRYRSQGERVKWVQKRLRSKGFFSVKVTGFYGEATREAVRRFQHKHNLGSDGVVGPATWRALSR